MPIKKDNVELLLAQANDSQSAHQNSSYILLHKIFNINDIKHDYHGGTTDKIKEILDLAIQNIVNLNNFPHTVKDLHISCKESIHFLDPILKYL